MDLELLDFDALVQQQAAALQGGVGAGTALNLTPGSVFLVLLEAGAGVALWLQWLDLQILAQTRAATSEGADLDSFYGDFFLDRLPAAAATGSVTFSRFTPTNLALVPVGAQVKTADGTQTFTVTADPTNTAYSTTVGATPGYVMAAGTASVIVPVVAVVAGSGGNVGAGTITLLSSSVSGVDTVTNGLALTNGIDAEADAAYRSRFRDYIAAMSRGTQVALLAAVESVQQGITAQVAEGVPGAGSVTIYVDDGTGTPSPDLIARCFAAADAVRPVGINLNVLAPTVVPAAVSMTLSLAAGADYQTTVAAVSRALTAYIDGLPLGATLAYSRLSAVAYGASASVAEVDNVLLNGVAANIGGAVGTVVRPVSVAVS